MSLTPPSTLRFKRGDTVMLGCEAFDDAGQPIDLTGVDVAAQVWPIKDDQPKVADLDLQWLDRAQGRYELWAPGDSLATNWPTGNLRVDIQYSQPSGARTLRRSSDTFHLYIEPDVTQ
jgi:hypothetical protein